MNLASDHGSERWAAATSTLPSSYHCHPSISCRGIPHPSLSLRIHRGRFLLHRVNRHLLLAPVYRCAGGRYPTAAIDAGAVGTSELHLISHCKAPLHWIPDFFTGHSITSVHILTKCGHPIKGAPAITKTVTLQSLLCRVHHNLPLATAY